MQKLQRKTAACVRCRQMKLKCDRHLTFPAPCSRCEKSQLHCSFDPLFKRTDRKQRLDVVERELREIKQKLQVPESSSLQESHPSHISGSPVTVISSSTPTTTVAHGQSSSEPPSIILQDIRAILTSRVLGDIELQPQTIADLVEEYYNHYHDLLPILPDITEFVQYVDQSPLLFWTIMVISLRIQKEHRDLYFRLAELLQVMACDIIQPSNRSLHSIQARLLLCCWPLPFGPTKDDLSHTYVSLATQNALRLGLHRPHNPSDFEYDAVVDNKMRILRMKTWIACFIINQWVSTQQGVPALIRLDHSLLEAVTSQPPWLPNTLFFQLQIARQSYQICITLGNSELTCNGLAPDPSPSVRLFDAELRMQEARFSQSWTKLDIINFLGCKLLLYSFVFVAKDPNNDDNVLQRELSIHWLPQAYLTATTLIQTASSVSEDISFSFIHIRRCLVNAIFFLIKLLHHTKHAFVDESTVQNCINQGWTILRSCSLKERDHMSRVCAVIEYLSNSESKQGASQSETFISIKSRMGANLSVDSVFRARDRFSEFVKGQRPADYTEAAASENLIVGPASGFPGTMWLSDDPSTIIDWDIFFDDPWSM